LAVAFGLIVAYVAVFLLLDGCGLLLADLLGLLVIPVRIAVGCASNIFGIKRSQHPTAANSIYSAHNASSDARLIEFRWVYGLAGRRVHCGGQNLASLRVTVGDSRGKSLASLLK
jgi:hypothetical protein